MRDRLASTLTFTHRYHRRPFSLTTLRFELGATVDWFEDADLLVPSYLVASPSERIIKLNTLIFSTPLHLLAIVHECCHHIMDRHSATCTEKMEAREERDAWFSYALVGVPRDMALLILDGAATVAEIAERCRVPEPLVMIRLALVFILGERKGQLNQAIDTIRYWLGRLETWIDSVKAWLCRRAVPA